MSERFQTNIGVIYVEESDFDEIRTAYRCKMQSLCSCCSKEVEWVIELALTESSQRLPLNVYNNIIYAVPYSKYWRDGKGIRSFTEIFCSADCSLEWSLKRGK